MNFLWLCMLVPGMLLLLALPLLFRLRFQISAATHDPRMQPGWLRFSLLFWILLFVVWPLLAMAHFVSFLDRVVLGNWLPRGIAFLMRLPLNRTSDDQLQETVPGFYALAVCCCIAAVLLTLLTLQA